MEEHFVLTTWNSNELEYHSIIIGEHELLQSERTNGIIICLN